MIFLIYCIYIIVIIKYVYIIVIHIFFMIFFLPGAEVWWKARKRPGLPRKRVYAALPLPQTLHFAGGP